MITVILFVMIDTIWISINQDSNVTKRNTTETSSSENDFNMIEKVNEFVGIYN